MIRLVLFIAAMSTAWSVAAAKDVVVCSKIAIPGKAHTLNPNAPIGKQRQELVSLCETVTIPDPPAWTDHYSPITDRRHDPRAFT